MGMIMQRGNTDAGTYVFDDYPTYDEWIAQFHMEAPANMMATMGAHFGHLPVWAGGNAYLAGARAWKKETGNFVNAQPVNVELVERDGSFYLKTNLYDVLGSFQGNMVSTETLGKAFEPEQPFENPDGTPIVFDTDYFGNNRSAAIPGPFARPAAEIKVL